MGADGVVAVGEAVEGAGAEVEAEASVQGVAAVGDVAGAFLCLFHLCAQGTASPCLLHCFRISLIPSPQSHSAHRDLL